MSTQSKTNRNQQQTGDQDLIGGLTKHASTLASLTIGGTSFTTAAIIAVLQERIATSDAAVSTRATWQTAVKADRDERAKTRSFVSGLRQALHVAFSGSIDTLADFGLKPRKTPAPRTPQAKALAVAKAQATRAARHTVGPKKKLAIKGTVSAAAPATPPSASAPAAAVPPAAPPTGATTPVPQPKS